MIWFNNFKVDWEIVWDCRVNLQSGTTYTLALTDRSSTIYMNNASANTLTIPLNSSVALPITSILTICQKWNWITTLTATAWVVLNDIDWKSISTTWKNQAITIQKIWTNEWVAFNKN